MCMWIFINFFEIRNDVKSVQANIFRFLLVSHFGRTPSHTYTICAHIHTHILLGHTYTYSHTLHVNTYTTCAHIHIPTYTTCAHTPHIKFSGVTELWHFSCRLPCIYIYQVCEQALFSLRLLHDRPPVALPVSSFLSPLLDLLILCCIYRTFPTGVYNMNGSSALNWT